VTGQAAVEFHIVPGGVAVSGQADVVPIPPPAQTCCPGLAGDLDALLLANPGTCSDYNGLAFTLNQVGQEWQGSAVAPSGRNVTIRMYCDGVDFSGWKVDVHADINGNIDGRPVTGGDCGPPLFASFDLGTWPVEDGDCSGLLSLVVFN